MLAARVWTGKVTLNLPIFSRHAEWKDSTKQWFYEFLKQKRPKIAYLSNTKEFWTQSLTGTMYWVLPGVEVELLRQALEDRLPIYSEHRAWLLAWKLCFSDSLLRTGYLYILNTEPDCWRGSWAPQPASWGQVTYCIYSEHRAWLVQCTEFYLAWKLSSSARLMRTGHLYKLNTGPDCYWVFTWRGSCAPQPASPGAWYTPAFPPLSVDLQETRLSSLHRLQWHKI